MTVDEQGVRLDHQRLLALQPEDLYAWHFAVAAAVRADKRYLVAAATFRC
ncbi:MAG: hypothetical protein R3C14_11460 [Caldilineaceae bacterium]